MTSRSDLLDDARSDGDPVSEVLPLLAGVAFALMGVGFLIGDYLADRRQR